MPVGESLHIAQPYSRGQTNLLGILFQCFFSDSSFQMLIKFKDYSQLATVQTFSIATLKQMHRQTETVSLRGELERGTGLFRGNCLLREAAAEMCQALQPMAV